MRQQGERVDPFHKCNVPTVIDYWQVANDWANDWAMYCDVARCLYASGGIAQYAVNQLVLGIIQTTSTTLDDLDNFQPQIISPRKTHQHLF